MAYYDVAPHRMTSAIAPRPFVVSESSYYSTSYAGWYAFNGVVGGGGDCWASANGTPTGWLQVYLGCPARVVRYGIRDRGSGVSECPRDFTLQGSNDGKSWRVLDRRTGIAWIQLNQRREFVIAEPGLFTYYRLDVTRNNGQGFVAIGEMYLWAGDEPATTSRRKTRFLGSETASNTRPQVYAGPDQTIVRYASDPSATMAATGFDVDGDTLTYLWEKVSGPGTVTFTNNTSPTTSVSFSAAGTYVLKITASDTVLTDSGTLFVYVEQGADLRISQLAVDASTLLTASQVTLRVSQLATEASSYSPNAAIRASQFVIEAVDSLTLPALRASQLVVEVPTTPQGVITLTPSTGALTITGTQPTVTEAVAPVVLTPSTGELTITGTQPTVVVPETGVTISPSTGTLTVTGNALFAVPGTVLSPATGTLTITGNLLSALRFGLSIRPASGHLWLNTGTPLVSLLPVGRLVSQVAIEVLTDPPPVGAAISQLPVEALTQIDYDPAAQVSQVVVETHTQFPVIYAQVSQLVVEVMVANTRWVDIAEFLRVTLNSANFEWGIGTVQIHLWSSSPTATVQARLYDLTHHTAVGESATVQSTAPVRQKFNATLSGGIAEYKLQVTSNESESDIFCIGYIRGYYWSTVEEPPISPPPPPPPPPPACPSWWRRFNGGLAAPSGDHVHHIVASIPGLQDFRWFIVTAIFGQEESVSSYAGDAHGHNWLLENDPAYGGNNDIGAQCYWKGVPGATSYRVYMFNCTSGLGGPLFDPHTANTNLVTNQDEPVLVRFKDVPAVPENFDTGWDHGWNPTDPPTHQVDFYSDTDGTGWTPCCPGE